MWFVKVVGRMRLDGTIPLIKWWNVLSFQASFYKRYGRRVSHKSCWGKEEAETDSEYQERILHQFGLKDQVIEVKIIH